MKAPPPLEPFGLVLHHDGSWTHEGAPLANKKLRERFDRAVHYLPEEGKYVVQIGHFRGEIIVEEAGFFVRLFDPDTGAIWLSDGTTETFAVASLSVSERDGAFLCKVKHDLVPGGLPARFHHAAHAELMNAVDDDGVSLRISGSPVRLPDRVTGSGEVSTEDDADDESNHRGAEAHGHVQERDAREPFLDESPGLETKGREGGEAAEQAGDHERRMADVSRRCSSAKVAISPIRKQPTTLTTRVPQGKLT